MGQSPFFANRALRRARLRGLSPSIPALPSSRDLLETKFKFAEAQTQDRDTCLLNRSTVNRYVHLLRVEDDTHAEVAESLSQKYLDLEQLDVAPDPDSGVEGQDQDYANAMEILQVLVVDDELAIRDLLSSFLKLMGHCSQAAANSADALSRFAQTDFDLVITDLDMPGMKGDELASLLKDRKPSIRVLLITGFQPQELSSAIDRVLPKPFSLNQLREAITALV